MSKHLADIKHMFMYTVVNYVLQENNAAIVYTQSLDTKSKYFYEYLLCFKQRNCKKAVKRLNNCLKTLDEKK